MPWFSIITSALAPGLALLTFFYLKDKYDKEPLRVVLKVFLLGFIIVFPVMIIQRGMMHGLGDGPFVQSFLISAGVEEALKWFVLFHIIYNHTAFDEPYDGILYAVAISLGFATIENLLYAWSTHASISTMFFRALLPVSGHALFGVIMGYYFGRAKFSVEKRQKIKYLILSFLIAWISHAVYDLILLTVKQYWLWFIVPLMFILWKSGMRKVNRANNRSPYRLMVREEEVNT